MKKMIVGVLLFVTGFVGFLTLLIGAIKYPITINNKYGLEGYLYYHEFNSIFIFFVVTSLLGLILIVYEAYVKVLFSTKK